MSNAHFGLRFSIPDEEMGKVFPLPEIPWEKIVGRLENMASGDCFEFHSGEELLACLTRDSGARSDALGIAVEMP